MPDEALPEKITVKEAYLAMFLFLNGYWEVGKRAEDEIANLCSSVNPYIYAQDSPTEWRTADPAMWDDWLQAVRSALDPQGHKEAFRLHR